MPQALALPLSGTLGRVTWQTLAVNQILSLTHHFLSKQVGNSSISPYIQLFDANYYNELLSSSKEEYFLHHISKLKTKFV